ncbi:hypothetical protein ACNOYE_37485 [Nannocystaceae bacterium ST9]
MSALEWLPREPRIPAARGAAARVLVVLLSLVIPACPAPDAPQTRTNPPSMSPSKPIPAAHVWLAELQQGPHAVGYRQQWFADPTRSLLDPTTGERSDRPILLSIWYPSDAGNPGGESMQVDDYLRVDAAGAGTWRARLANHVRKVRDQEVFGGEPGPELDDLPTAARRDASWADGRFPLVLAHPGLGGSFSDNFVLWEHLASHGFVVVSGAFLDASGLSSAIEWDPATSITDFDRMFEIAATWPGVDATRTVVIGHSYGGQAAIAYAMSGRNLVGVISLDSTLEYADPAAPWYAQPEPARHLGQFDALRVPALIFHAGGQTGYVERLTHSERTIVGLPALRHNDFIAHGGVLRAVHTRHADAGVRAGYVEVADAVRRFLIGVTGPTDLSNGVFAGPLPANWTRLAGEPPPPDLAMALAWIREFGPAGAWDRCAARKDCDAEVLLNDTGYVLMRLDAPELAEAVLATVVERVPGSWNAWDSWAEIAERRGDTRAAIERYHEALELVVVVERAKPGEPALPVHSARIEARLAELEAAPR